MEHEFSFGKGDLDTIPPLLLQNMLDELPAGVAILKSIRAQEHIIDFEFVMANTSLRRQLGIAAVRGERFFSVRADQELLTKLIDVVESGVSTIHRYSQTAGDGIDFFTIKCSRLADGVLLSYLDMTERYLSEQLHLDDWDFIEQIADSTPDIIYVLDLAKRQFIYKNKRGEDILGISEEESIRKGHDIFFDVTHPDDYVRQMEHYTRTGNDAGTNIHEIELRLRIKDGSYHWFRIRDRVFKRRKDGTALSIIGNATDIHQQKDWVEEILLRKEELQQKEWQYRSVLENIPDLITRWNHNLELLYASDSFVIKSAIPLGELIGKTNLELRIATIALPAPAELKTVFDTGHTSESYHVLTTSTGESFFQTRLVPEKNLKGEVIAALAITRDVTETKNFEQQLKQQAQDLQRIQETVPDMISVMDLRTRKFVYLNKGTFKFHGFDADHLNTMSPEELANTIHVEDREQVANYFYRVSTATDSEIITTAYRAVDESGKWKWFLVRGRVFERDNAGAVTHVLNVITNISAAKETEIALQEKNIALENLKRITDNSYNALISMDMMGRITYWNPAAEHIFGYRQEEVRGLDPAPLIIPPDNRELPAALTLTRKRGEMIRDMETTGKKNTGVTLQILVNIFPLKDDNGEISGNCISIVDITEHKKAQRRIKEDTHLIGQIVETSPDIIYILDLNTYQVLYTNKQVAAKLGYSKEQIAAMKNPFLDLMHPDDKPAMREHLRKIKTLSSDDKVLSIEYRMKNAKGGYNSFCDRNAVFKRDDRKIPVEKIGICQDITTSKQQEEQKITSHSIIHQTEEIAEIGSWEYDVVSGRFKWSEGMYRLFNLPPNDPISPEIYREYGIEEEHPALTRIVNNITRDYLGFEEVITLMVPGHGKKIVRVKAVPLQDEKRRPVKVIGIDLDITKEVRSNFEIVALNSQLMNKNADLETLNEELRRFNTIASHDYKETLQVLYTNLEFIISKDGRHLSDTSKANIRRAQSAIQKMKLLTDDINNYLQLYDIKWTKTWIDPNKVLEDVLGAMQGKLERAEGQVESTMLPTLLSDHHLLALLFTHIIDNSIKFRKLIAAPVIKIRHSQADEMNAVPGALNNTPYTIISITDNGIGLNDEEAEKIFELFYRIDDKSGKKGSGIGLAICKRIMRMHDGFITADGQSAGGATINCFFPGERQMGSVVV